MDQSNYLQTAPLTLNLFGDYRMFYNVRAITQNNSLWLGALFSKHSPPMLHLSATPEDQG